MNMDKVKLANSLESWAKDLDIGSTNPTARQFRILYKDGMDKVWRHLMKHIRSKEQIKIMKGNLKYYEVKKGQSKRQELLSRRKQLQDLLEKKKVYLETCDSQLTSSQESLVQNYICNAEQEIHDGHNRVLLLENFTENAKEHCRVICEYKKGIDAQVRKAQTAEDDSLASCTASVGDSCNSISNFLQELLSGKFGPNKAEQQHHLTNIIRDVESVMLQSSCPTVLSSLTDLTTAAVKSLKNKTENIDIINDAKKLKFEYERGKLKDTSEAKPVVHSVEGMREEGHNNNLNLYIETQKYLNESWQYQMAIEVATKEVHKILSKQYGDNPGALKLAKEVFENEMKTVALNAAIQVLTDQVVNLQEENHTKAVEKEKVLQKHRKIHDFNMLTEQKQDQIRALARQNGSAKLRLDKLQLGLVEAVQNTSDQFKMKVHDLGKSLVNCTVNEMHSFKRLHLPCLLFTMTEDGNKVPIPDMSIYRLRGAVHGAQFDLLLQVLQECNFPVYRASELFLDHVSDMNAQILHTKNRHLSMSSTDIKPSGLDISKYKAMGKEKQKYEQEKIMPLVQHWLSQNMQGVRDLLHLNDVLEAWWKQHAQHSTPWVQVDGKSFSDWMNRLM